MFLKNRWLPQIFSTCVPFSTDFFYKSFILLNAKKQTFIKTKPNKDVKQISRKNSLTDTLVFNLIVCLKTWKLLYIICQYFGTWTQFWGCVLQPRNYEIEKNIGNWKNETFLNKSHKSGLNKSQKSFHQNISGKCVVCQWYWC